MVGRQGLSADRRGRDSDLPDRVLHQPGFRRGRPTATTSHWSDFPPGRRHLRAEHRRGSPGDRRGADPCNAGRAAQRRRRQPRARSAPHLCHLRRRSRTADDQHASGVPFPSHDDDATSPRLTSHAAMSNTKVIGGRTVRWDDERAAEAYARGWWVRETLADSLADAARRTPQRVVLIDGDREVDCRSLNEQATALAAAMLDRMPIGSVVSFMLPNWHEASVIYLAATLAGMVV